MPNRHGPDADSRSDSARNERFGCTSARRCGDTLFTAEIDRPCFANQSSMAEERQIGIRDSSRAGCHADPHPHRSRSRRSPRRAGTSRSALPRPHGGSRAAAAAAAGGRLRRTRRHHRGAAAFHRKRRRDLGPARRRIRSARRPKPSCGRVRRGWRGSGCRAPKIRTLKEIARAITRGELALAALGELAAEDAHAALTAVHGIGPWTADIYLLSCLGHADAWPAGDLALQEAARLAFGLRARPTAKEMIPLAEPWRPWRSVAARVLWTYYRAVKGREGAPVASRHERCQWPPSLTVRGLIRAPAPRDSLSFSSTATAPTATISSTSAAPGSNTCRRRPSSRRMRRSRAGRRRSGGNGFRSPSAIPTNAGSASTRRRRCWSDFSTPNLTATSCRRRRSRWSASARGR